MKDLKHYLVLIGVLSIGLALFWFFNYNRQIQVLVVLGMALVYVFWGVIHHQLKKDFHWRIITEYIAVAAVVSIIVIFLLFRA
jgi:hypothetical protein